MDNPADLHPVHLAEDCNLYWPIVWYYGSVYTALLHCCGHKVVKEIYGKLAQYRYSTVQYIIAQYSTVQYSRVTQIDIDV